MAETNKSNNESLQVPLERRIVRALGEMSTIDLIDGLPDSVAGVVRVDSANHAARATDMITDFGDNGLRVARGPGGYDAATLRDSNGNNVHVGSLDGTPEQITVSIPSQTAA